MYGHDVRRWNYPAGYQVPARMPDKVRRVIKAMEMGSTTQSPVPALARELEARCRDFRRMSILYEASDDGTDPAHTYWPEAYLGVIETADWLRMDSSGPVFQWAQSIFASEMARHIRGLPSDAGLSDPFKDLLAFFEDRLARIARTSHNEAVLFEAMPNGDRMPELQIDFCLAAGQAIKNLDEVFEWAREAFPQTLEDRLLKMRIVEIAYGPKLMISLHARLTWYLHSRANLIDLRNLRKLQVNRETRMKPMRFDHKDWAWIYRKKPHA